MGKAVKPKQRLHTKTKVKVQLKRRRSDRKVVPTIQPKPVEVLLPQLQPCDVILEYKRLHVKPAELEELLPSAAVPCPLKLGGQKLELPVGAATQRKEGSDLVALNVGCHVGCMAWSPCGLVLALSVHNRRQPALGAEGPVHGMAALQLWRVAFGDPKVAQLRLGLVHQGAQARSLQWMASKKAKDRIGLLLAALGDGTLCIYSLPETAFATKALSCRVLFARFRAAWTAQVAPTGYEPASAWQRHIQCAAALGQGTGALLAAGCDRCVVLLWRLKGQGTLPTTPCEVLKPGLQENEPVVSIAWCPRDDLLVAGLSTGYMVLWDPSIPVMPLRCFLPSSRLPMVNLLWLNAYTIGCPSESVSLDMRDERMSQFRPRRGGQEGKHLVRCTGMCLSKTAVVSSWSDGVVDVKPCSELAKGRHRHIVAETPWQCWSFSGKPDLDKAPLPYMAYECPKEEPARKEYVQKLFQEYQHELLNYQRIWESKKCVLEIGTCVEKSATPVPLSCIAAPPPAADGSVVTAAASSAGIVSLKCIKG